jgi:hypothetical protein
MRQEWFIKFKTVWKRLKERNKEPRNDWREPIISLCYKIGLQPRTTVQWMGIVVLAFMVVLLEKVNLGTLGILVAIVFFVLIAGVFLFSFTFPKGYPKNKNK